LILANLGTPSAATPEAVREFLAEFLSDPLVADYPAWLWQPILRGFILPKRPARIARLYQSIWREAGSPLDDDTRRLARAAAARLGSDANVVHAFRYGERRLERVVEERLQAGDREMIVVPLFPQRTSSSSGSIVVETERLVRKLDLAGRLRVTEIAPAARGYIDAVADRVKSAFGATPPDHLLVSFHGIPLRYDLRERGQYRRDCEATSFALLRQLGWRGDRATLAYQSQFGPEPWIKPTTAVRIRSLAAEGVQRLAVVTPGFVTDGLETLEEIAIQGRETFLEAGGREYVAVPAIADHPRFVDDIVTAFREAETPAVTIS
jgi:ferrochelatase